METNTIALQFIQLVTTPRLSVYVNKQQKLAIGYNRTVNVHKGTTCTEEEADLWLKEDINRLGNVLYRSFPYQLNPWQTTALLSLAQEITVETFRTSQLYSYLLAKEYSLASQQFILYHFENTSKFRRIQERNLFNYIGVSDEL
jgi:GH24 family phage-related lysozyme (muramidase)